MRGARLLLVGLVFAVGCIEPTVSGRQARGRTGNGSGSRSLGFTVQPRTIFAGETMGAVEVTARDGLGNRDTAFAASVSVTIGANPGGGTLSGTTSAAAVAGVARFGGLTIDRAGTGYTLVAAASGASGAVSTAFDVVASTTP